MNADAVTDEVRALKGLDLEGLRAEWRRRRYGVPPRLRSPELVRHMLAWRIQANTFGGLDVHTRRRLRQCSALTARRPAPSPGTELRREWAGITHEVTVTPEGFIYNDQRFGSLSQVARTITGARWNGPKFFGLRAAEIAA